MDDGEIVDPLPKAIPELNRSDVMADDINTMLSDMIDAALKTAALSDAEQDELWDELLPALEAFFGYPNYRGHN